MTSDIVMVVLPCGLSISLYFRYSSLDLQLFFENYTYISPLLQINLSSATFKFRRIIPAQRTVLSGFYLSTRLDYESTSHLISSKGIN